MKENGSILKKKPLYKRIWEARIAYILLLPLVVGLLITSYYPPVSGFYHAFFDWNPTGVSKFVGLDNFKAILTDKVFLNSIPTLFVFLIPRLAISVIIPLVMAELIFSVKNKKAEYRYRVAVLLPMVAPGMVTLLMWQKIYDAMNGLLTGILKLTGLVGPDVIIDWLGSEKTVIASLIFINFPWIGGTAVLIYMAGLMNISPEIIESCRLEGCGILRRIIKIDLPMLSGQLRYFLVFGLIGLVQDYNAQMVITSGGPGYKTYVPGYYMYVKAFGADMMGYASAVGVLIFISIFALTVLAFKYTRFGTEEKS